MAEYIIWDIGKKWGRNTLLWKFKGNENTEKGNTSFLGIRGIDKNEEL